MVATIERCTHCWSSEPYTFYFRNDEFLGCSDCVTSTVDAEDDFDVPDFISTDNLVVPVDKCYVCLGTVYSKDNVYKMPEGYVCEGCGLDYLKKFREVAS